jgi:hypothetical protein
MVCVFKHNSFTLCSCYDDIKAQAVMIRILEPCVVFRKPTQAFVYQGIEDSLGAPSKIIPTVIGLLMIWVNKATWQSSFRVRVQYTIVSEGIQTFELDVATPSCSISIINIGVADRLPFCKRVADLQKICCRSANLHIPTLKKSRVDSSPLNGRLISTYGHLYI